MTVSIPVVVIAVVIALLLGGAVGALMVALGQHAAIAKRAAAIRDRWQRAGHQVLALEPLVPTTPQYVHRIVDAYATGDRLDFGGCWVPADVQGRLRVILAGAAEATRPLPDVDRHPLTGPYTLPSDPAQLNAVLRARAATKAGR